MFAGNKGTYAYSCLVFLRMGVILWSRFHDLELEFVDPSDKLYSSMLKNKGANRLIGR